MIPVLHLRTLLRSTVLIVALLIVNSSQAQNKNYVPNAFVDVNKVLQAMPGYQDSVKGLDNIRMMYQNQYNLLLVDLQQKIKTYEAGKDSLSPFVANTKLKEIKNSQANLDTFQALANQALKFQQDRVLQGFLEKIREAVTALGQQGRYGTVWDSGMLKSAIWTDPKSDITQDVITQLLNPSAPPPASGGKPKKSK